MFAPRILVCSGEVIGINANVSCNCTKPSEMKLCWSNSLDYNPENCLSSTKFLNTAVNKSTKFYLHVFCEFGPHKYYKVDSINIDVIEKDFKIKGPEIVCYGNSAIIDASESKCKIGDSYFDPEFRWLDNNSNLPFKEALINENKSFSVEVSCKKRDVICVDTLNWNVLSEKVEIEIEPKETTVCIGEYVNLRVKRAFCSSGVEPLVKWFDGTVSKQISFRAFESKEVWAEAFCNVASGCSKISKAIVRVVSGGEANAVAGEDKTIRKGEEVILDGSASSCSSGNLTGFTWYQSSLSGKIISNSPVVKVSPENDEVYILKITCGLNPCSVSDYDTVFVKVIKEPSLCESVKIVVNVTPSTSVCPNTEVFFDASNSYCPRNAKMAARWSWGVDGLKSSRIFDKSELVIVTLFCENEFEKCELYDSIFIQVYDIDTPDVYVDTVEFGNKTSFICEFNGLVSWDFDNDNIIDATGNNVSYAFKYPGEHTIRVIVVNEFGCAIEFYVKAFIKEKSDLPKPVCGANSVSISSNPFNLNIHHSFEIRFRLCNKSDNVSLIIYDMYMVPVRELDIGRGIILSGENNFIAIWDGTMDNGKLAQGGNYIWQIKSDNNPVISGIIVFLR